MLVRIQEEVLETINDLNTSLNLADITAIDNISEFDKSDEQNTLCNKITFNEEVEVATENTPHLAVTNVNWLKLKPNPHNLLYASKFKSQTDLLLNLLSQLLMLLQMLQTYFQSNANAIALNSKLTTEKATETFVLEEKQILIVNTSLLS